MRYCQEKSCYHLRPARDFLPGPPARHQPALVGQTITDDCAAAQLCHLQDGAEFCPFSSKFLPFLDFLAGSVCLTFWVSHIHW